MRMAYDGGREKKKRPTLYKVVIRRLPPYMTWEELKEQLNPLPPSEFVSFVPADLSFIPHAFSRCYFAFSDENAAVEFGNKFNRYVFVDKKGYESAAIVELAMFQRVPRKRREDVQKDQRCGIIEKEVEYCRFVDELESSRNCAVLTIEEQLRNVSLRDTANKAGSVQETPLTQFVMRQNDEKLIRKAEEKRKALEERKKKLKAAKEEKREKERPARKERNEENVISFTNSSFGGGERSGVVSLSKPISTAEFSNVDGIMKKLGITQEKAEAPKGKARPNTKKPERERAPKAAPLGPRPPRTRDTEDRKPKKDRPEREIYRPGQRSRARAAEETNGAV